MPRREQDGPTSQCRRPKGSGKPGTCGWSVTQPFAANRPDTAATLRTPKRGADVDQVSL